MLPKCPAAKARASPVILNMVEIVTIEKMGRVVTSEELAAFSPLVQRGSQLAPGSTRHRDPKAKGP